jgi:hypothetical protein
VSLLELLSEKEPVIQFSEVPSPVPAVPSVKDEHWKEMIENTRQLYGQVITSKDEKIANLENELSFLRKERDRIMRLLEKLADGMPMLMGVPS